MENIIGMCKTAGIVYKENEPLCRHMVYRTGGKAAVAAWPQIKEQLMCLLYVIREHQIPYRVVGHGTRQLFRDDGFDGFVIFTTKMKGGAVEGEEVLADAGISITELAYQCGEPEVSLTGLEPYCGDIATVGGLLLDEGSSLRKQLVCAEVFDMSIGERVYLDRDQLKNLRGDYIILNVRLQLAKGSSREIRSGLHAVMREKTASAPYAFPHIRAFSDQDAERIRKANIKGRAVGGAELHESGKYIVNRGSATTEDILKLVSNLRHQVWERLECLFEVV